MDNFFKALEHSLAFAPFMASVNGKPKLNTARILEQSVVVIILWWLLQGVITNQEAMKEGQNEIKREFEGHKQKTEQRLGNLENDMKSVKEVIYIPLDSSIRERFEQYKKKHGK